MPRPNVTFKIVDESLVIPLAEATSSTIGGCFNPSMSMYGLAGTTTERVQQYFFSPDQTDWYNRLTNFVIRNAGGLTFAQGATGAMGNYSIGKCAATYVSGEYEGAGMCGGIFADEWWAINNFLQYGGGCYVGFNEGSTVPAGFKDLPFDIVFQGGTAGVSGSNYASVVETIVDARSAGSNPVFGVVAVGSSGAETITSSANFATYPGTNYGKDYNYAAVFGEKVHLDLTGSTFRTTQMAPDLAGCLVRNDRDGYPWFSPAGPRRGRILNVVRLNRNLTEAEQDIVYESGVNPVVTFPGDGTILFGDKTGETDTSTLSRINVSRLFQYIKRVLGPVARGVLFEQNDSFTRERFTLAAQTFLNRIVAQRGISEFRIICDSTNNTAEVIEGNYFVADILIKPVTSINFVTITLTNKDLSSSF